jgi:DNA-binding response OmpR family regulator
MVTATATATPAYKVVIVNGRVELLELFESVLDGSRFDVVLLESSEHAYSQVKRMRPHLVVLCLEMDDAAGFHVLSMLSMDDDTKRIPVLTCTTDFDGQEPEYEAPELPDDGRLYVQPAALMN